jgi:putative ABC transport system ATP-binding protein
VFQDYALLPELTATENIMVPLLMTGMSKKDAEKKAHEALRKVDMSDRRDHLPSQLSGGQQQRVSIARAISNNPRILFADEPTANLDIDTAKNIFEVFNALHRAGQTIIMVTHESEVKNANITRHISMLDGEIEKDERIR